MRAWRNCSMARGETPFSAAKCHAPFPCTRKSQCIVLWSAECRQSPARVVWQGNRGAPYPRGHRHYPKRWPLSSWCLQERLTVEMPNAALQARPEAGAKRRLEGVACKRWLDWDTSQLAADTRVFFLSPILQPLALALRLPYWMTSSAWKRNCGESVRPSALALLRFTTNSNRSGCSTGRSAGVAPRRILSIWTAARATFSPSFRA